MGQVPERLGMYELFEKSINGGAVMLLTHIIKLVEYWSSLPPMPLDHLPSAIIEWAQYLAKLTALYIAVLFG